MHKPIWAKGYRAENEYPFGLYPVMNPDILTAYALLQGVKPDIPFPTGRTTRDLVYCELGSGQGVTLNFMAARDPVSDYYGIDYNPNHVRNSRAFAKMAGLENANFIERSFADLDSLEMPDCDLIVLHGIWSWIDAAMRDAIVRFVDRKLKPGGLVYVSYNCAVGRSADDPMRKLFLAIERSSPHVETNERMSDIFHLSTDIAAKGAAYFANRPATVARLKGLAGQDPNYMEQEYLNENWTNFFFEEVSQEMSKAKMNFVCSTTMTRNIVEYEIPAAVLEHLGRFSSEADVELLKDIWQDTLFRQDVFVKGIQRLSKQETVREVGHCHFALAKARGDCSLEVRVGSGTAKIPKVPYSNILDLLAKGPTTGEVIFALVEDLDTPLDPLAVLKSLIAFGYVLPVPDPHSIERAKVHLQGFEAAYDHFVASKFNRFVGVIPGLATTTFLSMLEYYFWQAHRKKVSRKPQWVQERMAATGRKVSFEGKPITDGARALELLKEYEVKFEKRIKPLMQLGYR